MTLPKFKYHPDPVGTGNITAADTECACCGRARGYVYVGPVYAEEEYEACICPWCIADGSAHEKLGASFTDEESVGGGGGYGDWEEVADEVIEEVAFRTPGFSGWQQEAWWTHCSDAAEFLGRVGKPELEALGAEAVDAIRESMELDDGPEWQRFFNALDKEGGPTAYLFRCRHCGKLGGYQDSD